MRTNFGPNNWFHIIPYPLYVHKLDSGNFIHYIRLKWKKQNPKTNHGYNVFNFIFYHCFNFGFYQVSLNGKSYESMVVKGKGNTVTNPISNVECIYGMFNK